MLYILGHSENSQPRSTSELQAEEELLSGPGWGPAAAQDCLPASPRVRAAGRRQRACPATSRFAHDGVCRLHTQHSAALLSFPDVAAPPFPAARTPHLCNGFLLFFTEVFSSPVEFQSACECALTFLIPNKTCVTPSPLFSLQPLFLMPFTAVWDLELVSPHRAAPRKLLLHIWV